MLLKQEDLERLCMHYILASGPSFVWKKFREDESVRMLSQNNNIKLLSKEFEEIVLPSEVIKEIVYAYALLIALLMKDPQVYNYYLAGSTNLKKLDWGYDMVYYSESKDK